MIRYWVGALVVVGLVGCGDPRTEVAKDKVLSQIDRLLGEMDVRKKEAAAGARNMEAALDGIKRGRIEAKVRLAHTDDRLADVEGRLAAADKALVRLRGHLSADAAVTLNGRAYSPAEIKDMADRALAARKALAAEADALRGVRQRFEAVVTSLDEREREGRGRLRAVRLALDEIDAKAAALKAVHDAARLGGGTAALDFEGLERQVRDLSAKIDVELAFHDEKWKEQAAGGVRSLEAITRATGTPADTLAEIDWVVGRRQPE